ncbi:MAG TPA: NADH dehydrogenase subunit [Desulfobacteraceae bacterium]|nr:NADH dehydrogenase subunit [Bacteroidales bacterium]HER62944.1 NADH dehydrogenase subunit [Desulfobacteraceae bacterium]
MINTIVVKNNQCIPLPEIPVLAYHDFLEWNTTRVKDINFHCVSYFGWKRKGRIRLFCCMADDAEGTIAISSAEVPGDRGQSLPSFTARHFSFHCFERDLHEKLGINYSDHPWLKPLRYPVDRADQHSTIENYPFFSMESEELHEVGVGPVHAGIIEPGHFRFICNGEQILHLEIQLGYQHRGIEQLFISQNDLLKRNLLAESIAGDSVIGHTVAFANAWESLCGFQAGDDIQVARTVASELERIAIHTGDLSALCTDVAYQLGSSVFGRLRTPVINTFQVWCGNRLAKGLIRAGKNQYPLTGNIKNALIRLFDEFEPDFNEMYKRTKTLPSVLARMERTGILTTEQAVETGAVGMAARSSGLIRDIRWTHPCMMYASLPHQPVVKHHGDVYSRMQIRRAEVNQSIRYIRDLLDRLPETNLHNPPLSRPKADVMAISLTEGWRGEICHCAITDHNGELALYNIKDPSMHNWMALALAVRHNDISDFPICNKSFNLSYCGHDL